MRKEIVGIFFVFLVIFVTVSLVSYSPDDPSINTATTGGNVHNLFGVLGAHLAGALVALFGLGAFWLPVLFLMLGVRTLAGQPPKKLSLPLFGGLLLIVASGGLLSLGQDQYELWGSSYSAGGIIGIPLQVFLVKYANFAGGTVVLLVFWVVGLVLATGISLTVGVKTVWRTGRGLVERVGTLVVKWRARRQKVHKRAEMRRSHNRSKRKAAAVKIKTTAPKPERPTPIPKQAVFDFMKTASGFQLPSYGFLDDPPPRPASANDSNLRMQSKLLEKKLSDFAVHGEVTEILPGPVITTFEYKPAAGVKINKIVNLTDDLALALRAESIRIVAPIPGKAVIGIEIPNTDREIVRFKEVVVSKVFEKSKSSLTLALGKDIVGQAVISELEKMPHLLIAGATGSGKSVALNTMICSLLYKSSPEDVKLIMVDPKRIELSIYDGIPHLITPVVKDVKKATNALFWAVREMERRYERLAEKGARNLSAYNKKIAGEDPAPDGSIPQKLPLIVIIIDELADLMMVASRDVEVALTRLAQMARAAGIHLILATQRPSVDVLTGIIKANFPTRLTFQVSSRTDSRTILDANGAENLLGNGDMLLLPPGTARLQRIHGAYISEAELVRITNFVKEQKKPEYMPEVVQTQPETSADSSETEFDERYDDAVALVTRQGQASISMVQRHLRIGYNRAARIIETMEHEGVVGPSDGAKPREVLARSYDGEP